MINKQPWPHNTLNDISSAWKGLEDYIIPIIDKFNIKPDCCLEFGVDLGYSSYIFSQVFKKVIGVDKFEGDNHINHPQVDEFYEQIKQVFNNTNVDVVRADFRDFIKDNNNQYDLIHIDIVHFYDETFECADWAVKHSNVVILHDTCSFPDIDKVCHDITLKHNNVKYYNISEHFGLGVLYS